MKIIPRGFEHLPALKNLNYVSFGTGGGDPKWEYFHIINEYAGDNILTINLTTQVFSSCSLEYSFDKKTWEALNYGSTTYLTMPEGSTVYLRGTDWQHTTNQATVIKANNEHSVGGCILSLLDYTNMKGITEIPEYAFYCLFKDNKKVTNAINLNFGNVTVLGQYACGSMFNSSTALQTAPRDLSTVTTINTGSCKSMFSLCSALKNVPYMPNLTTIGYLGCTDMFNSCKMTTGLDLSNVTSVDSQGCSDMYNGCTKLQTIYAPDVVWRSSNFKTWIYSAGTLAETPKIMYFKTQESMRTWSSISVDCYGTYTKTLLA